MKISKGWSTGKKASMTRAITNWEHDVATKGAASKEAQHRQWALAMQIFQHDQVAPFTR